MKCCRVQVYLAGGADYVRVGFAPELALEARELAKRGVMWIWPLTSRMGLYRAYTLAQELRTWPWEEWQVRDGSVSAGHKWSKGVRWTSGWWGMLPWLKERQKGDTEKGQKGGLNHNQINERYWEGSVWQKRVVKGLQWLGEREGWLTQLSPGAGPVLLEEWLCGGRPERLAQPGTPEVFGPCEASGTNGKSPAQLPLCLGEGLDCPNPGEFGLRAQQIAALLRGRNLYLPEIAAGLQEMGVAQAGQEEVLYWMIPLLVAERVEVVPANLPEEPICLRCGHTELFQSQCGICGDVTWYCPECREMGESLTCRPLFRRADLGALSLAESAVLPHYTFPLSAYQEMLSKRLLAALEASERKEWLLWAVCGAGKTETTFGLIGGVLGKGGRVLFTSPRREVVRQMVERLTQAFPETDLVGLFGGSEEKFTQAQLTLATVHQLVRFYQAFDLIIFDEVDAYPFKGDARLQRLLARSRKVTGRVIYLSATPDASLLEKARQGELELLTLPARFHRKGVPVPDLRSMRLPQIPKAEQMPAEIQVWIQESVMKELAQIFIFLPTRKMVEEFGQSLQQVYRREDLADWVEYTHSKDGERSRKVESFLRGDYPILVTSTIVERGVTVPKGNVLVLYADTEEIFDSQSLVQMAGRAGRSLEAPHGNVLFVGRRISEGMQQARDWIQRMNSEARERGLLDETDD